MLENLAKHPVVPRGTELLKAIDYVLPYIKNSDSEEYFRYSTVINLLSTCWDILQNKFGAGDVRSRYNFISTLNELYEISRLTEVSTACGVLIVASHIEASYLDDDDAELVHSLTALHIHRAKAVTKARAGAP